MCDIVLELSYRDFSNIPYMIIRFEMLKTFSQLKTFPKHFKPRDVLNRAFQP